MKFVASVVAAGVLVAAAPASAASFLAQLGSPVGTPSCGAVSSGVVENPIARELICGAPFVPGGLAGRASATYGHVGGSASAFHGGFYFGTAFGIGSQSQFSDFVTFSSSDPLARTTTVAANMDVSGLLAVTPSASAYVYGVWSIDGVGVANFYIDTNPTNQLNNFILASGPLGPGTSNAILRTVTFTAPLDQQLRLTLQLFTGAGVAGSGDPVSGRAEFSNSFEVPFGMDAFVLSQGVTANSGTWLINNRRVDLAGAVPEPSTWALLILGLGAIGAAMRQARAGRVHALAR